VGSILFQILLIPIPQVRGENQVHQTEPPYQVRLVTSWRSLGVPECTVLDRLAHYHSSYRHGDHTIGLGIVLQGLLH
jgi:hypothetical protein